MQEFFLCEIEQSETHALKKHKQSISMQKRLTPFVSCVLVVVDFCVTMAAGHTQKGA